MADKPVPGGPTSIRAPWALVKRGSTVEGHRPATRIAYLVRSINGADGRSVALAGFIGNDKLAGWSKSLRRVEWEDILSEWRSRPSADAIRRAKQRIPRIPVPS